MFSQAPQRKRGWQSGRVSVMMSESLRKWVHCWRQVSFLKHRQQVIRVLTSVSREWCKQSSSNELPASCSCSVFVFFWLVYSCDWKSELDHSLGRCCVISCMRSCVTADTVSVLEVRDSETLFVSLLWVSVKHTVCQSALLVLCCSWKSSGLFDLNVSEQCVGFYSFNNPGFSKMRQELVQDMETDKTLRCVWQRSSVVWFLAQSAACSVPSVVCVCVCFSFSWWSDNTCAAKTHSTAEMFVRTQWVTLRLVSMQLLHHEHSVCAHCQHFEAETDSCVCVCVSSPFIQRCYCGHLMHIWNMWPNVCSLDVDPLIQMQLLWIY